MMCSVLPRLRGAARVANRHNANRNGSRRTLIKAFSTSPCSASSHHSDDSAPPGPRPLSITLPDLNPREESFVRSQVDLIKRLEPQDLERITWEHASALVRAEFPSFLLGKKSHPPEKVYKFLTRNSSATKRTVAALKELGVTDREVRDCPHLLAYPFSSLARDCHDSDLLGIPLVDVSVSRVKEGLRGKMIHEAMDELVCSLVSLGMISPEVAANVFDRVRFAPLAGGGKVTLRNLNRRAVSNFVQSFFPEDFRQEALDVLKAEAVDKPYKPLPITNSRAPQWQYLDARCFARNHHIYGTLLDAPGLFTPRMLRQLAFRTCPLETLIVLNDLYETLEDGAMQEGRPAPPSVTDLLSAVSSPDCMHHLLYPSLNFPPGLKVRTLLDIGFTHGEASQILLSKNKAFSDKAVVKGTPKFEQIRYSSVHYVPVMRHRLSLLRKDGARLGVSGGPDSFSALTHWTTLLQSLRKIAEGGKEGLMLHYSDSHHFGGRGVIRASPIYKSCNHHPASAYLYRYFGCSSTDDKRELRADAFVSEGQKSVPLGQVTATVQFLESRGFGKEQMRAAVPLLFYPASLVEENLREMEQAGQEEDPASEGYLRLCLYFVEKEFHFSGDGFYVGLLGGGSAGLLSEEMLAEIEAELGPSAENAARTNRAALPPPSSSPLLTAGDSKSSASLLGRSLSFVHQQQLGWRQQQQQQQQHGLRQLHTCPERPGPKKPPAGLGWAFNLVLQSPFKMLRIHTEFLKLKAEWDPTMDKEAFVEATKEAVSTVTHLLGQSKYSELRGLLSRKELQRLRREVETSWDDVAKNNVAVAVENLVVAFPDSVMQQSVAYQRFCDINMVFVAVKGDDDDGEASESPSSAPPRALKILARFHRDYTEGKLPDWVITRFNVERVA